ncbi:MarR family winged helix-turn-helix transcriptional regulator [Nocardia altamirensis]|uniref:MarR family winged helix-turn-helix transcriptional regulator n=1 Tax=Nocardia altamirensis TaxID=472158 RepID=UPI00083FDC87|nr:MarR family winged helix-turn-helix transcriptional regulator [Nocardia altamirensis]
MEPVETACVCTSLRMATRSVVRLYDRALGQAGLRHAGYSILARIDAEGPLMISELADRLVLERTTCSREVDALAKAGLLTIEAGSDRRQRVLRLSQAGAAKLGAARQHWHAVQEGLTDSFGVEDADALLDRLRSLLRASQQLIDQ